MKEDILGRIETLHDTQSLLHGAPYYKIISEWMKRIHSGIPFQEFNTSEVAAIDTREEYFENANQKRAVIYLRSNGCEWALKSGNGCLVCGHIAKQTRKDEIVPAKDYLNQFMSAFNSIDFCEYPLLNLYNNGSFFNDNEISAGVRLELLKAINQNPYIKMLVIESRPEFIEVDKINELKELIPQKHVEVAIGLEVMDDFLRYVCLNKGFSLKQFEKAAKMVTSKLNLRTYVMLKPPFLSEREAIEESIRTIEYAFAAGSSTISLETCTIQDYTLTQHLNDIGLYDTAWLWSIIEVIKRTAHLGKLIIGLFQFYPSPKKVPYNCELCSDNVMQAIRQYNRTLDVSVFDGLDCACKEEWKKELESKELPFDMRLRKILERLTTNA